MYIFGSTCKLKIIFYLSNCLNYEKTISMKSANLSTLVESSLFICTFQFLWVALSKHRVILVPLVYPLLETGYILHLYIKILTVCN